MTKKDFFKLNNLLKRLGLKRKPHSEKKFRGLSGGQETPKDFILQDHKNKTSFCEYLFYKKQGDIAITMSNKNYDGFDFMSLYLSYLKNETKN